MRMFGVRARRAAGLALGVTILTLLDIVFYTWPRLTGRAGGRGQNESLR